MKHLMLLTLLSCITACTSVSTAPRPASYQAPEQQQAAPDLFGADQGKLDNAQIAHALDYQIKLPAHLRIAVIQISDSGSLPGVFSRRDYDYAALRSSYADFFDTLRKSPRVYDASYFPSLLLPHSGDLDSLRSAAARYQTDLLLAYRSRCDVDDKTHAFSASEVQAHCMVDALLLDIRSGLVIFSSVADQDLHALKSKDDIDFDATIEKARTAAIGKALVQIAGDTDKFLAAAPGA